jgi:hypothetical protein
MQLIVNGYNVKYICVDVSGALLLLLVGFCFGPWAYSSLWGFHFMKWAFPSGLRFLVEALFSPWDSRFAMGAYLYLYKGISVQ